MNQSYTGADNLEVMTEAINYNHFLLGLILENAASNDRVVDFGAGIGTFAELVKGRGHLVHGVELDSAQRNLLIEKGIPCTGSLTEATGQEFDFAYSLNVLEHIENDVQSLRELFDALKPGGKLLIYVPAFMSLYTAMDRKVGHLRRYRRAELVEKLKRVGFEVSTARYVDSLGFFATLAYKFFGNKSGTLNLSAVKAYDRYFFPISCFFDRLLSRAFGKNLLVIAVRPAERTKGGPAH